MCKNMSIEVERDAKATRNAQKNKKPAKYYF